MMLSMRAWIVLGVVVAILGLAVAVKVQTVRLDACRAEFAAFVAAVKVKGEAQEKASQAQAARDRQSKEKADAQSKRALTALRADNERLRNASASRSLVPLASPATRRPDLACFDRAELVAAVDRFRAGARGLAEEGDEGTVNLNAARQWAERANDGP